MSTGLCYGIATMHRVVESVQVMPDSQRCLIITDLPGQPDTNMLISLMVSRHNPGPQYRRQAVDP